MRNKYINKMNIGASIAIAYAKRFTIGFFFPFGGCFSPCDFFSKRRIKRRTEEDVPIIMRTNSLKERGDEGGRKISTMIRAGVFGMSRYLKSLIVQRLSTHQ